jgi:hypothetical protein
VDLLLLAYYYLIFGDFLICKGLCSFINLNKYIKIFPPTYFVRLHVESIYSESLGPSKVPLTILSYNSSIHAGQLSESWCKFFPVGNNFIGSRTQNTLNLIFLNITECYLRSITNGHRHSVQPCFWMDIVHGKIKDGRRANSVCEVNGGLMFTLIIADSWEHNLIKENSVVVWKKLRVKLYPNVVLVFHSSTRNSIQVLCAFNLERNLPFIYCIDTLVVSKTVLRNISAAPVSWAIDKEFKFPQQIDFSMCELRKMYSKDPLDDLLLVAILRGANESVHADSYSIISRPQQWPAYRVSNEIVLVTNTMKTFLSCHCKPVVKFEMYVKPFQLEVWFSLFLCCSLIGAFISIYNMKFKLSKSFSSYFFFVSTLFEEPYSVPSVLWNNRVFKTVTITWLLTAMVFTNLYIGLMISDVTSPLQGERLVSFDQVLDTEIVANRMSDLEPSQIQHFWLNIYNHSRKEPGSTFILNVDKVKCNVDFDSLQKLAPRHKLSDRQEGFAILQKLVDDCGGNGISSRVQKILLRHPWMYSEFKELEKELLRDYEINYNKVYQHRTVAFFAPRNRHYPRNPEFSNDEEDSIKLYAAAAIEKELVACENSIFMSDARELKYELAYLNANYPRKGFYMSEEMFENGGSNPVPWKFMKLGRSKVLQYFKLLIESGIREGIIGIRKHKYYLLRRIGTKLVRGTMSIESNAGISGSIQTIFFILVFSLTIASLFFVIELLIKKWRVRSEMKIWKSCRLLIQELIFEPY